MKKYIFMLFINLCLTLNVVKASDDEENPWSDTSMDYWEKIPKNDLGDSGCDFMDLEEAEIPRPESQNLKRKYESNGEESFSKRRKTQDSEDSEYIGSSSSSSFLNPNNAEGASPESVFLFSLEAMPFELQNKILDHLPTKALINYGSCSKRFQEIVHDFMTSHTYVFQDESKQKEESYFSRYNSEIYKNSKVHLGSHKKIFYNFIKKNFFSTHVVSQDIDDEHEIQKLKEEILRFLTSLKLNKSTALMIHFCDLIYKNTENIWTECKENECYCLSESKTVFSFLKFLSNYSVGEISYLSNISDILTTDYVDLEDFKTYDEDYECRQELIQSFMNLTFEQKQIVLMALKNFKSILFSRGGHRNCPNDYRNILLNKYLSRYSYDEIEGFCDDLKRYESKKFPEYMLDVNIEALCILGNMKREHRDFILKNIEKLMFNKNEYPVSDKKVKKLLELYNFSSCICWINYYLLALSSLPIQCLEAMTANIDRIHTPNIKPMKLIETIMEFRNKSPDEILNVR